MDRSLLSYGLQYGCYLIEASLVFYLARSRQQKGRASVGFYLCSLLAAELVRACALHEYGFASRHYYNIYWTTDFLLVISAFILVCLFFRRACLHQQKMWHFVRLLVLFVFVLVVGISGLSFSHNYIHLFTLAFVIEFNQNLYFTCLVLNTLLYLLLRYIESADDQLGLLVCGVGIQFAGPAATLALVHLTTGEGFAKSLLYLTIPLCSLGMLLVWAYAIVRVQDRTAGAALPEAPVLAEATANSNV
jgi:hypothetical protein